MGTVPKWPRKKKPSALIYLLIISSNYIDDCFVLGQSRTGMKLGSALFIKTSGQSLQAETKWEPSQTKSAGAQSGCSSVGSACLALVIPAPSEQGAQEDQKFKVISP